MQSGNMLSNRLLNYSVLIIQLSGKLNRNYASRHIRNQLVRSATSAGANYEEARGASSRYDFKYKLSITIKELRESLYWIKLLEKSNLYISSLTEKLKCESIELCKIFTCSIKTLKKKQQSKK